MPDGLSPDAKSLIKRMLRMNPHERPSAQEVIFLCIVMIICRS